MPPRVLFTTPFFLPHVVRGAEREAAEVAALLVGSGYDLSVLTTRPRAMGRRRRDLGFPVEYVHEPLDEQRRADGWDEASMIHDTVARVIDGMDVDLVHCWHYADAVGAAHRRPGVPMVLKMTGTVLPERIRERKPMQSELLLRALQSADEIWCNSEYARETMAGFGVPMRIVPAGLHLPTHPVPVARSSRPLAVVAAAAEDPRKRVSDVIDAWPAVLADVPDAQLELIGETPKGVQEQLLQRIPAAAHGSISFGGLVRGDLELYAAYERAWAVLAPGVHEALGRVTIEALAAGTPVIGADSGATTELIIDVEGCALVEPFDVSAWSEAIVAALQQPPAARLRGCIEAAEPFGWSNVLPIYLQRYHSLIGA